MTWAVEGSLRRLTESVPRVPGLYGVRGQSPELRWGPRGPCSISERWKAPTLQHKGTLEFPSALEKPAEASPLAASGSALALQLQGFLACPCARCGYRQ